MPGGLPEIVQPVGADTSRYIAEYRKAREEVRGLIGDQDELLRKMTEVQNAVKKITISVDSAGALGEIAKVKAELDALPDSKVITVGVVSAGGGNDIAGMINAVRDLTGALGDHATALGDHGNVLVDHMNTVYDNTTALNDQADAASRAAAAFSALAAAQGRAGGGGAGWAAAAAAGRGGGGGGWGAAAAGAAAGAAGGGGGGGGGAGGFVPWAGGGWQAVRFWGMMSAEVLSTVVPAAVAAGAAALVGMQGGQQLYNRYQAIASTAEALGGAYGQTTGSYILGSPKGSALQAAQNYATGGVYELAGAGINMLRGGAGQGFLQTGVNTIAMLDRSVANISPNLGQRIAAMMGGGTGYLQQFGQIGANLGNTLLNVAPNLPGVGADLLGALKGGTGLAATVSRDIPGPLIGAGLAAEAASRWGPALLGGKGLIGRMLGLGGVGGIGGLLQKGGLGLIGTGSDFLGSLGLGMGGFGEALAGLGGPELALPAAIAMLATYAARQKTGPQAAIAGLQGQVAAGGFSGAWQPLGGAITKAIGLDAGTYQGGIDYAAGGTTARGYAYATGRMPKIPTAHDVYSQAATGFAQQMGDLVNAGPQLVDALHKAGLKSVSMADAFQIAQNSLLDLSHAFDSHGNLTKTAQNMLKNYVATIGPMTQSGGAFGAAIAGQTIMSSGAMQNLSKVNQAMDSMQQIIAGGPTGVSALAAASQALPAGAMSKALTSYTAPGSAAAWQAFASTSTSAPGVITQMQQFADQMRTYMTLGTATPGQTAGLGAFELKQMLPMAKGSPAALAMLMQQGAAMGVGGYYDTSKTQGQNYAAEAAAIKSMAYSSAQVKSNMDSITIKTANLPAVAKQFVQGANAQIQAAQVAKAAQDAVNIKGGINIKANTADLISQLKAAGVQGGAALKQSLDAILSQAGVGKAERIKIEAQVTGTSQVQTLKELLAGFHSVTVAVRALADSGPARAMAAAIASVQGKTVVITTIQRNIIETISTSGTGAGQTYGYGAVNTATGQYTAYPRAAHQQGFRVPGYGGGDIWPALLEPGEAVVPKHLVGALAPFLSAHGVPGFAGGRIPNAMWVPPTDAGNPNWLPGGGLPIPAAAQKVLDQLLAELSKSGAWKQAGVSIINGITYSLSGTGKDAGKVGAELVKQSAAAAATLGHKIQAEFNLARGVAGAALAGQGYGTQGLISGMNVTPGTGGGTVLEQMQSYLGSEQSFTKDISTLRKQHLSKALIAQMVAAGPVQGDALAQSVLNDYGGVKAVNATWNQIGQASKGLGAQAAMAQFGGFMAPNLKSGTFSSNNITINVNAPGGAQGNLPLTESQINALVREIQAKLLQQARRNNKTGVKASGKGA